MATPQVAPIHDRIPQVTSSTMSVGTLSQLNVRSRWASDMRPVGCIRLGMTDEACLPKLPPARASGIGCASRAHAPCDGELTW